MKHTVLILLALLAGMVWSQVQPEYKPLTAKRFVIDEDLYGIYEFSQKPQMGTVILKVQVFNKKGEQVTPFTITGRSDMPSMSGAHDSGEVDFKLNSRKNYLLPVDIVMPGDWEIRLIFRRAGKPVFHGAIRFNV